MMISATLGWFCGDKGDIFKYGIPATVLENVPHNPIVKFYPNPSDEWFIIENNNYDTYWNLSLYDLTGKLILQRNQIKESSIVIKRNELKSGMYFLKVINSEGQIHTEKIIFE